MMEAVKNFLTTEDYRRLRKISGLSEKSCEAAEIALKNTLFSIAIVQDSLVVGIGRVIGDGGAFVQIVDICVDPNFQGKGLGKKIMTHLMEYIHTLPKSCYVSLLADGNAKYLYEKFGFQETAPNSVGMALKL